MRSLNLESQSSRDEIINWLQPEFSKWQERLNIPSNQREKPVISSFYPYKNDKEDKLHYSIMKSFNIQKNTTQKYHSFSVSICEDKKAFSKSRIYGLKTGFDSCPDILLPKEEFKSKYESIYIPSYDYEIQISSNPYYYNKPNSSFLAIYNKILPLIESIFRTYGELEEIIFNERKSNGNLNKHFIITNNLKFLLSLKVITTYHIINRKLTPDYTIELTLTQIKQELQKNSQGTYLYPLNKNDKKVYFRFNIDYFYFLNKPNYFLTCMTPHGYVRLKESYIEEFVKQIVFHYMFKRYFGRSEIEVTLEDLNNDPMSYFYLAEMVQI